MINTIKTPRINTNDDKVGLVAWHVKDGDYVEIGQAVADLETSKAVVTVDAEHSGYVKTLVKQGSIIKVGLDFLMIADELDEFASKSNNIALPDSEMGKVSNELKATDNAKTIVNHEKFTTVRFSNAALEKIKSEDLKVENYNLSGLITVSQIESKLNPSLVRKKIKSNNSNSTENKKLVKGPIVPREEAVSLAKLSEIEQLSVGEAGGINSTISIYFESQGIRNRLSSIGMFDGSISPIILYELSKLLLKWPQFLAYFEEDQVHYYDRVDLGIALDLGKGLKVVRIKDADTLSPQEIFEATIDFGLRYLDNKLKSDELVGSTMTITDLSGYNILHFRPLINGRQSAILGIGGDSNMPNFPMSISMAFDHRVSNGREAAIFLNELRSRIISYGDSNPSKLPSEMAMVERTNVDSIKLDAVRASSVNCDTCGIDIVSYDRDFGRDAKMVACFNLEGKLFPVCHRCYAGWI